VSTVTGSTEASAVRTRGRRRAEGAEKLRETPTSAFLAVAGRTVFTGILVLAALVFLFLAVGPRFLGYQTSTMLTGSMSPEINAGDVVVSVKTPLSELKVGDVITYSIPIDDRRVETHRVQSIKRDDAGGTSVITKGDANPGPDPWTAVLSEDYVYTKAAVLPYLGNLIRAMRQPILQSMFLYGGSALLVVIVLTSIWGKSDEPAPAAPAAGSMPDDSPGEIPGADPDPRPAMSDGPAPEPVRGA
jgi:signal peptidase